jgi:hypothetical protein
MRLEPPRRAPMLELTEEQTAELATVTATMASTRRRGGFAACPQPSGRSSAGPMPPSREPPMQITPIGDAAA